MSDLLAPVRSVLARHRALADHADDMESELFDLAHRKPPYAHTFGCGCRLSVERSSDEGGEWQNVWTRCETYRENA